jgi:hypothetical protein
MAEFPATAAPEDELADGLTGKMRFAAQALEGIDPVVVEGGEMRDAVIRPQGNKEAFAYVFFNLLDAYVATIGGKVEGNAFCGGLSKLAVDAVAHGNSP